MSPYGFLGSISTESRCRRASTTGCYLPASPPKSTAGGTAGSLSALTLYGAIILCNLMSHLSPGNRFHMLRIDQHHRSPIFQDIVDRVPIHTSRLEGNHIDFLLLERIIQRQQISGHGRKGTGAF